jgi:vancomycin resistance protein VanJ
MTDITIDKTQKTKASWRCIDIGIRWTLLVCSACLFLFVITCYTFRFDSFAVITAFPAWIWFIPGFIAAILARLPGRARFLYIAVAVMWVGFVLVFADEPVSIARGTLRSITSTTVPSFCVVSVNCCLGNPLAALDAAPYEPDILLLQESPGRDKVAEITHQLFGETGSYLYGGDTVIIVRGKIEPSTPLRGATTSMIQGHVKLVSGLELEVASIHLAPPPGRFDFWSPAAWKIYAGQRRTKRMEIANIVQRLNALPPDTTIVIGGDFNMPSTDGAWDDMPPYLHDTFYEAGVGWGNTITSTMPVVRFDQIWVSANLKAVEVKAVFSKNTDHLMVVSDIAMPIISPSE